MKEKPIRLEDNFEDVIGKAAAGLGLGEEALAGKSGLPVERARALLAGRLTSPADLEAVAGALGLRGDCLLELARQEWEPPLFDVEGLSVFTTPYPIPGYEEMTVNSYLVQDPDSPAAVAFDAGADASPMLREIGARSLEIRMVLLTHAHGDHVQDLERLVRETGSPPVWLNEQETLAGAEPFPAGRVFQAGSLRIQSRLTSGHSPGGTTYVIEGLGPPVAIVGDSLFCCSQGGARGAYAEALENNRREILSLPEETILCPGHGPLTTVGGEKRHNPFFPEFA
ncbi:MAG: MBL fold metallo-hydrolase [Oceanipulchritudo sp.]